jgi:opacity protein-like surface antigen
VKTLLILALLAVALMAILAAPLLGVLAIDWNHAVAQVRVDGLSGSNRVESFQQTIKNLEGYRRSSFTPAISAGGDSWKLQIEFQAGSMAEATVRLWNWQEQFHPPVQVDMEQVRCYTWRLHRRKSK